STGIIAKYWCRSFILILAIAAFSEQGGVVMKEILWLMQKTFRTTFRNKLNILLYVLGSVLGVLLELFAFGEQREDSISVGVDNNDQLLMAAETIKYIKE